MKFELTKETKERHGMRYTRFYSIWCGMKNRCQCKTSGDFKNYGAKGITVCKEWQRFSGFKNDMLESYVSQLEKFGNTNTTLDRVDASGEYSKKNCRWATKKEQAINKNSFGMKLRFRDLCGKFSCRN